MNFSERDLTILAFLYSAEYNSNRRPPALDLGHSVIYTNAINMFCKANPELSIGIVCYNQKYYMDIYSHNKNSFYIDTIRAENKHNSLAGRRIDYVIIESHDRLYPNDVANLIRDVYTHLTKTGKIVILGQQIH